MMMVTVHVACEMHTYELKQKAECQKRGRRRKFGLGVKSVG